jgi:hypothetical protein
MMIWMKSFRFKFIVGWAIVSLVASTAPGLAQTNESRNENTNGLFIRFIQTNAKPPSRGTPPSREGTGSRGDCLYQQNSPGFTRLVGSDPLKFTVKEHPTVWIYVPYSSAEAPVGEFSLQDDENEIYRTQFQLPKATPGIVGIVLPSTLPPLAVGREYRWYVDITCPRSSSSGTATPASITGVVERIAINRELEQALKMATPVERVRAYANHGIWYETLTELAQLRLQNPQNPSLEQAWIQLLSDQNIGLVNVAKEPISGTVTTNFQPK